MIHRYGFSFFFCDCLQCSGLNKPLTQMVASLDYNCDALFCKLQAITKKWSDMLDIIKLQLSGAASMINFRKYFDTNNDSFIFEGHNHDLNYLDWPFKQQIPEGLNAIFNTAELLI